MILDVILASKKCVICQCQKTSEGGSGYEPIIKCITTSSAEVLNCFGKKLNNPYIQTQLANIFASEIIAKEFYFHRTCYKNTSRLRKPSAKSSEEEQIRDECLNELNNYVNDLIMKNGQVLRISQLTHFFYSNTE